jgi:zinc transporter ZupT
MPGDTLQTNDGSSVAMQSPFMPIILSLLAGLSTCFGAAIVFLVDKPQKGMDKQRRLGHREMSFSLSLAAAVMITVSFASILPECLTRDEDGQWLNISSSEVSYRVAYFAAGCFFFVILSKFVFPEPEHYYNDVIQGLNDHDNITSEIRLDTDDEALLDSNMSEIDVESQSSIFRSSTNRKAALATQRKRTHSLSQNSFNIEDTSYIEKEKNQEVESSALLEPLSLQEKRNYCWLHRLSLSGADLKSDEARRAWRVTVLLFVSLAVHNFPEGKWSSLIVLLSISSLTEFLYSYIQRITPRRS